MHKKLPKVQNTAGHIKIIWFSSHCYYGCFSHLKPVIKMNLHQFWRVCVLQQVQFCSKFLTSIEMRVPSPGPNLAYNEFDYLMMTGNKRLSGLSSSFYSHSPPPPAPMNFLCIQVADPQLSYKKGDFPGDVVGESSMK